MKYEIFYNYEDPYLQASGRIYNQFPWRWYIVRFGKDVGYELAAFQYKPDAEFFCNAMNSRDSQENLKNDERII